MNHNFISQASGRFLLGAFVVLCGWAPTTAQPPAIATRQRTFVVPFRAKTPVRPAGQAGADPFGQPSYELLVSTDAAATWRPVARAAAEDGRFVFSAPADGEYWFAMRTTATAMRSLATPEPEPETELRVIVDTTPPQLTIHGAVDGGGAVNVDFTADDPRLDLRSLTIEYRLGENEPWRPAPHDILSLPAPGKPATGQAMWFPRGAAGLVLIRGGVRDVAGNETVVHRELRFTPRQADEARRKPGIADRREKPATPDARKPSAANTQPWLASRWPQPQLPRGYGDGPPRETAAAPSQEGGPGRFADFQRERPGPEDRPAPRTGPTGHAPAPPPSANVDWTNTREFDLHYNVDAVGPTGVARVELWMTEDGGQTWTIAGEDEDRHSPIGVTAPAEGVFGYRMVITAGNGVAGPRPRPGEQPDVTVGVDWTPPRCEMTAALFGRGSHAGQLEIRWRADDERLAERPIRLLYRGGPLDAWRPIAHDLPNMGGYIWNVDGAIPREFYLRLEARDVAGNVGSHELRDPLNNEGLAPRGRIQGMGR